MKLRTIKFGKTGVSVPPLAVGCMRIYGLDKAAAEKFVRGAIDAGANFFDHADVYGGGKCEEVFAEAAKSVPRDKLILQSKCGIRQGEFDFSKEHILSSADAILKRLGTDYLDVLLLHRPDALAEPEEVAEAFDKLYNSGKVRFFGVSNQKPAQIKLLQKYVKQPICANQLQLSVTNATLISQGLHVNMLDETAVSRDEGVLDFCRLEDITIQAWSPLQYGFFEGAFLSDAAKKDPRFEKLNAKIGEIAEKYGVSDTTIAIAWILRHPAKIQAVTGTVNPARLADCFKAADVELSRKEWYEIFLAAGNVLP